MRAHAHNVEGIGPVNLMLLLSSRIFLLSLAVVSEPTSFALEVTDIKKKKKTPHFLSGSACPLFEHANKYLWPTKEKMLTCHCSFLRVEKIGFIKN